MKKEPKFPNKILVIGVIFVLAGGSAMLWTLGLLPSLGDLWPLPLILLGMYILYSVFLRGKKDFYILPGMVLTLGGILFLLLNTVITEKNLSKIWPAFMLVTGLCLIPYALRKKARYRIAVLIPAISIIILSCIFLPFSLGIAPFSFTEFVLTWWPVLILVVGGFLIVYYSYSKQRRRKTLKTNQPKSNPPDSQ
ncbi:MAG: hypothetical protein JW969_08065 [Spirochaetales bacterium]|nr:hypothetical protein [Spirochaetales bacterium]